MEMTIHVNRDVIDFVTFSCDWKCLSHHLALRFLTLKIFAILILKNVTYQFVTISHPFSFFRIVPLLLAARMT